MTDKEPEKASPPEGIQQGEPDPSGGLTVHRYQRAGQARQISNELANLEAYGSGDSDRAKALRKDLEQLGMDERAAKSEGPVPAGRSARADNRVDTNATEARSGGLAAGVSTPPAPPPKSPATTVGGATVTTKTEVTTNPPEKPASK